ncbi:MAG: redoxin domain-containing protein [Maricaulaceae bacterium]|nr:redoxin domain-containing protein [Maricaulaceae bacterium]
MKLLASFASVAALALAAPALAAPEVGAPAPAFSAVDSNGVTRSLGDFAGEMVILEWTNHDCPYVVKHYATGNMQALQADATADGIVWLSIISSRPGAQGHVSGDRANELTESRGASPSAVLIDEAGDVGRLYGAVTTPQMFIIDADGIVQYMGAIDDQPSARHNTVEIANNYVRAALAELAAGEPVSQTSTTPYGCRVHY